ncbi:50S ribosomal protein L44e [Candidatus Pacearchaeota archaeon]|nr:50S ribosomal protein L44e [Candidatus Pacearchaeota archaeon]
MKFPKKLKRYCPSCRKHTEHKISDVSSGHKRGTLKRGSPQRAKLRGKNRGYGNLGRYSKPPITRWKRKTKSTKKTNIMYTCQVCKKSHYQKKGRRTSKIQIEEKTGIKKQ